MHQVRPLLAARGFAVADRPGLRIRTLEDLFAYAETENIDLRIDGTRHRHSTDIVLARQTSC